MDLAGPLGYALKSLRLWEQSGQQAIRPAIQHQFRRAGTPLKARKPEKPEYCFRLDEESASEDEK
jgi:hypothetical protein